MLVTSRILTQACSSFLRGEGPQSRTGGLRKPLRDGNELPEDDSRNSFEDASEPSVGGRPETWEERGLGGDKKAAERKQELLKRGRD